MWKLQRKIRYTYTSQPHAHYLHLHHRPLTILMIICNSSVQGLQHCHHPLIVDKFYEDSAPRPIDLNHTHVGLQKTQVVMDPFMYLICGNPQDLRIKNT
jgi:hypothetical protein